MLLSVKLLKVELNKEMFPVTQKIYIGFKKCFKKIAFYIKYTTDVNKF